MKVKVLSVFALANAGHSTPECSLAGFRATLEGIRAAVAGKGAFAELVTREIGEIYLETSCGGLSFHNSPALVRRIGFLRSLAPCG